MVRSWSTVKVSFDSEAVRLSNTFSQTVPVLTSMKGWLKGTLAPRKAVPFPFNQEAVGLEVAIFNEWDRRS